MNGAVAGPAKGAKPNLPTPRPKPISSFSHSRPAHFTNHDSQSHSNPPPISIPNISQQRPRIRQRTTSEHSPQEPEDQDGCDVFTEGATDLETDVAEKGDDEDGSAAE